MVVFNQVNMGLLATKCMNNVGLAPFYSLLITVIYIFSDGLILYVDL